jgi:hypothetical protein
MLVWQTGLAQPRLPSHPRLRWRVVGLQRALDGFVFWGNIRGALQVSAFFFLFANLWALAAIF